MTVLFEIKTLPSNPPKPLILTIGMFDGVHLGHQKVLEAAKKITEKKQTQLLCITFRNNPRTILQPDKQVTSIYPMDKKIELLKRSGVDIILMETFTKEFADQTAYDFLNSIHRIAPFSDLVLGYNATIGRDQINNRDQVLAAGKKLNVNVHYVNKVIVDNHPISSSRIRALLVQGDISQAEKLLGRMYE